MKIGILRIVLLYSFNVYIIQVLCCHESLNSSSCTLHCLLIYKNMLSGSGNETSKIRVIGQSECSYVEKCGGGLEPRINI